MPLILVRPIWQTMTRKSSDSCSLGRTCAPTPGNSASSRRLSSMVNCQKGARMSCFPAPASTSFPLSRRSATARSGLTDSVRHGRTGVLVDDKAHLFSALDELRANKEKRAELGRNARGFASQFSWEAMGKAWEELLRRIVS